MAEPRTSSGPWALLSLHHSRALIRRSRLFALGGAIAVIYAIIAMIVGGMLTIFSPPAHLTSYWVILTWGTPWWNYPGLLAVNPYFALALPFLPTTFMILTSAGVGLGMTVAVVLSARLIQRRRSASARPAAVGTAAGLTPALIALVTLGACCSTTAAATAGIGITAQATGTSAGTLLLNNWYLGVFQLAILYVALLAQEQLVTIYGALTGAPETGSSAVVSAPRLSRRFAAGAALRVVLLAAGVTWCLAVLADWLTISPATASAGLWASWLLQHFLVGLVAMLAALFPTTLTRALREKSNHWPVRLTRLLLAIGGVSLMIGVPPPLSASGWHGFVNEVLAVLGLPGSWGAVAPGLSLGAALALRWAAQYVLLGAFALVLGARPEWALRPILWSVSRSVATPSEPVQITPDIPRPSVSESRLPLTTETDR